MSNPSSLPERLERALAHPDRGVLGLVDELLAASHEQDIQLGWDGGRCHISLLSGGPPERIEVPLEKSIVRAALARVAALCNERAPNTVSPYGGQGELAIDSNPAKVVRVSLVNTREEQYLNLALRDSARPKSALGGELRVTQRK